jgi:TatA/E family protein of Tat protein translocase
MFGIGITEILLILGIALVIIGPKNLPELARSVGKGYAEFMKGFREIQKSLEDDVSNLKSTVDPLETEVSDLHKSLDPNQLFDEQDEQEESGAKDKTPNADAPSQNQKKENKAK